MSLAAITEIKLGDEIYETAEEKAEHSPVAPTRIHYTPEQWVRRAEHTHRGPDGRRSRMFPDRLRDLPDSDIVETLRREVGATLKRVS